MSQKYYVAMPLRFNTLPTLHPTSLLSPETRNNLIELYEAWDKPEKAKEWQANLPQTEVAER